MGYFRVSNGACISPLGAGLIFTCYNLRRIFNLIGKNQLKECMKRLAYLFVILIGYFKLNRRMFGTDFFEVEFSKWRNLASLNGLYLGKKRYGFESNVAF